MYMYMYIRFKTKYVVGHRECECLLRFVQPELVFDRRKTGRNSISTGTLVAQERAKQSASCPRHHHCR